ncbi:MAG: hypothetical protein ABIN89_15575 [Chitinophagaceae bacterium]
MKSFTFLLSGILLPSTIIFFLLSHEPGASRIASESHPGNVQVQVDNYRFMRGLQQKAPTAVVYPDSYTFMLIMEPSEALKMLIDEKAAIKNMPSEIDQLFNIVSGVGADGVTKLIVVVKQLTSSIPAKELEMGTKTRLPELTLSLPGGHDQDGSLSDIENQNVSANSVTIKPVEVNGHRLVIAIYTPPDAYGINGNVPLTPNGRSSFVIATASSAGSKSVVFNIHTPPVILIPTFWTVLGNKYKFAEMPSLIPGEFGSLKSFLIRQKFLNIQTVVYPSQQSWYESSVTNNQNIRVAFRYPVESLQEAIEKGLQEYRDRGIVATQVDVIGHGTGGLIARWYTQTPNGRAEATYKKPENYQLGTIHKLITVGTPHLGTPLASVLWNHKLDQVNSWEKYLRMEGVNVNAILQLYQKDVGTVFLDLQPNSDGLKAIKETKVKAHAITGNWKGGQAEAYNHWNTFIKDVVNDGLQPIDAIIGEDNDLISGITSQRGGLTGTRVVTDLTNIIHMDGLGFTSESSNTETTKGQLRDEIQALLLSQYEIDFATSFPAPVASPPVKNENLAPSSNIVRTSLKVTNKMVANSRVSNTAVTTDRIEIISPAIGSSFLSHSNDSITLEFQAFGTVVPKSAVFLVKDIGIFAVPPNPPYRVKFKLPLKFPVNRVPITAMSRDINGVLWSAYAVIFIQPTGTLSNFEVSPGTLSFDSVNNRQALTVSANFINGLDTSFVNLSSPQSGTTFKARKGKTIIQVDENGGITAVKQGTDVLDVMYADKLVSVSVNVISACSVTKPVITVSGSLLISSSPSGNQWFLNGDPIDSGFTQSTTEPGYYSLQVTKACASPISDVIAVRNGVLLSAKAFLQGGYNSGLMVDSLRKKSLLPSLEPYSTLGFRVMNTTISSETVPTGLYDTTGNMAIVDWVWLELRDTSDARQVITTRSALLRRDGNIVDVDGFSAVRFEQMPEGNYYVAVRHRNHLGVMTASSVALNNSISTSIDFTSPATVTYGTNAQKNNNGVMMLWAGDVNRDGIIKYNGSANDKALVLQKLGVTNPTGTLNAYDATDLNMDASVKYNGSSNDKTLILSNVGVATPNNSITEQLPK